MRSSKSRSRSKANRPRTLGNIINRVFDSSGPEGKVRGTPQQIIEKYQLLARDAQLSNDRVAAENFLQHAEHYTRMLGEAMREMAAEQEERQRQQQSQPNHNGNNGNGGNGQNRDRDGNRDNWRDRQDRGDYRNDRSEEDSTAGAEVIDLSEGDGNLVETPEARPFQPRRDDRRDDRREDRGDRPAERQDRNEPRGDRPEQRNEPRGDRPEQRGDRNERRDRGEFRRDREDRRDGQPRDAAKAEQPKVEQPKAEVAAPQPVVEAVAAPQPEAAEAPKKPRGVRKPRADKPKGDNGPAEAAE